MLCRTAAHAERLPRAPTPLSLPVHVIKPVVKHRFAVNVRAPTETVHNAPLQVRHVRQQHLFHAVLSPTVAEHHHYACHLPGIVRHRIASSLARAHNLKAGTRVTILDTHRQVCFRHTRGIRQGIPRSPRPILAYPPQDAVHIRAARQPLVRVGTTCIHRRQPPPHRLQPHILRIIYRDVLHRERAAIVVTTEETRLRLPRLAGTVKPVQQRVQTAVILHAPQPLVRVVKRVAVLCRALQAIQKVRLKLGVSETQ